MDKVELEAIIETINESTYANKKHIYVYRSHLGGYYVDTKNKSNKSLFCETCGDSDTLVSSGKKKELKDFYNLKLDNLNKLSLYLKEVYGDYPCSGDFEPIKEYIENILSCKLDKYFDEIHPICPKDIPCITLKIQDVDTLNDLLLKKLPNICKYCSLSNMIFDLTF